VPSSAWASIDWLLTERPELRERLVFVQIGVPSRSKLESYASLEREIDAKVAGINARHGRSSTDGPIRYRKSALKLRRLVALYRLADFCIVSSLHDGMNLVAKEFVASRVDDRGVLILSTFAGAALELSDALLVNPYDVCQLAEAIHSALEMPEAEQATRMHWMRRGVREHNIYRWAANLLSDLTEIRIETPDRSEARQPQ
jgi:trehalose 6-phosphate synthase